MAWFTPLLIAFVAFAWRFWSRSHVDESQESVGYRQWVEYEEWQGPHGDDGSGV